MGATEFYSEIMVSKNNDNDDPVPVSLNIKHITAVSYIIS